MQRLRITSAPFLVLSLGFFGLNLLDPSAQTPRITLQLSAVAISLGFLLVYVRRFRARPAETLPPQAHIEL